MSSKQDFLLSVRTALDQGLINEDDLRSLLVPANQPVTPEVAAAKRSRLTSAVSAVDIMFYIAGIVLFAALMVSLQQSWQGGGALTHIFLSAGIGIIAWIVAAVLLKTDATSDLRRGLTNALLLVGSLSIIVGGFVVTHEILPLHHDIGFISAAITLAIVGAVHLIVGYSLKRDLLLLLGMLLGVTAFPLVIFRFLSDASASLYVWCLVIVVNAGLLAWSTRVLARIDPLHAYLRTVFDSLTVFTALLALYIASFGNTFKVLWLIVLIFAVIGLFYLSIVLQKKTLLGNGSLFLVIAIITIAFRYFSGFGIATSLMIAALGLLGTAAAAASINKRYFSKYPPQNSSVGHARASVILNTRPGSSVG